MSSKLITLRSQLNRLRRRRHAVRWCSALCAPAAIVLWFLIAAFLADWSLDLPIAARGIVLSASIAGGIWACYRFAWPLISVHESVEDVALVVERQHAIDSDLVAALQFEKPSANGWGSNRLSQAVVDYVAEFSPSLNVFEGFSYHPLPRRALAFATTLLVAGTLIVAFPDHTAAFWNRFLLGSTHYPTRTRIDSITVQGQLISAYVSGARPLIRVPYGQPIELRVRCAGEVPSAGVALLEGIHNDSANRIDLTPLAGSASEFTGEIQHVGESFRIRFHFGDAISDPAEVMIVPLPLVDLAWEIIPPEYALSAMKPTDVDSASRQQSVLEGSAARVKLTCSNKSLNSAKLTSGTQTFELVRSSGKSDVWMLPSPSPFDSIHDAIRYEIQVVDADGLTLETPLAGQFRLKLDRVPRIVGSAVTRQVLPTAQPKLDYAAGDDFGVARVVAQLQIAREDGRSSQHEIVIREVTPDEQPLAICRGQVAIPLSSYELAKGDEVKVSLSVTDWRGSTKGQSATGNPVSFNVTDLNGILAQTGEEDKKSAKQLDEILRRELGVGGEKK